MEIETQVKNLFYNVTKAIFPVAGLGTRFLPATKASPKEMLVVVDKPLIQYAVEDAYEAGIREMIFITGRNKRAIEDHFDFNHELDIELCTKERHSLRAIVESIKPDDMECVYIRQPKPLGLGHAILCAERLICGEPFAVLLADDLMVAKPSVMKQMMSLFHKHRCNILATQHVSLQQTQHYGIVGGEKIAENLIHVTNIIEKPHPSEAPSTLAISGRYILMPSVFEHIRALSNTTVGELQLTDGIASLLPLENVIAYCYQGRRYDCGHKLGLLQANVDLAELDPDIGEKFSAWLESRQPIRNHQFVNPNDSC